MARLPVPSGSGSKNPSSPIIDTGGKVVGFTMQNVSAVDIYVSEDRTRLDDTDATDLPTAGLLLSAANQSIAVVPRFVGKLYARSQAAGGRIELISYDIC